MRQNWYMGFGLILLMIAMYLVMLHNGIWFLAVLAPLLLIWIYNVTQTKHAILRNFPVLGHIRFIFEFIRPEIQQYFIASNEEERPFNRETRSLVYQRAKGELDTLPFGTEKNIYSVGYTWVQHSIVPKTAALLPPKLGWWPRLPKTLFSFATQHIGNELRRIIPACSHRIKSGSKTWQLRSQYRRRGH